MLNFLLRSSTVFMSDVYIRMSFIRAEITEKFGHHLGWGKTKFVYRPRQNLYGNGKKASLHLVRGLFKSDIPDILLTNV
jgi:hypothetical protein